MEGDIYLVEAKIKFLGEHAAADLFQTVIHCLPRVEEFAQVFDGVNLVIVFHAVFDAGFNIGEESPEIEYILVLAADQVVILIIIFQVLEGNKIPLKGAGKYQRIKLACEVEFFLRIYFIH